MGEQHTHTPHEVGAPPKGMCTAPSLAHRGLGGAVLVQVYVRGVAYA